MFDAFQHFRNVKTMLERIYWTELSELLRKRTKEHTGCLPFEYFQFTIEKKNSDSLSINCPSHDQIFRDTMLYFWGSEDVSRYVIMLE